MSEECAGRISQVIERVDLPDGWGILRDSEGSVHFQHQDAKEYESHTDRAPPTVCVTDVMDFMSVMGDNRGGGAVDFVEPFDLDDLVARVKEDVEEVHESTEREEEKLQESKRSPDVETVIEVHDVE